ncbi:MAG: methyltransferase domain-containing protein [Vicinamibacterales bacterium]|nr:methyltransferase domain-containing protein [Vicinamibacterales bacterium]
MAFFRRSGEKHDLAIAMTGIKLGDRYLQIGCSDSSLLAAVGSKVGLSGRACALVFTDTDATRARRGAEAGGMLLEIETSDNPNTLPFEDASFDLVVVDNQEAWLSNMRPEHRVACLQQAFRALAPRGRIVVLEQGARAGLGALLRSRPASDPHYQSSGGAVTALKAEGFKSVRQLAERDGLSFFEGVR